MFGILTFPIPNTAYTVPAALDELYQNSSI